MSCTVECVACLFLLVSLINSPLYSPLTTHNSGSISHSVHRYVPIPLYRTTMILQREAENGTLNVTLEGFLFLRARGGDNDNESVSSLESVSSGGNGKDKLDDVPHPSSPRTPTRSAGRRVRHRSLVAANSCRQLQDASPIAGSLRVRRTTLERSSDHATSHCMQPRRSRRSSMATTSTETTTATSQVSGEDMDSMQPSPGFTTRSGRRFAAFSPRLSVADTSSLRRMRSDPLKKRSSDPSSIGERRHRLRSLCSFESPRLPPRQLSRDSNAAIETKK